MARRPFDGAVNITQEYGEKNSFYRKGYHTGVDYGLSTGHKLVSPTSGTVIETGYEPSTSNGRGNYIIIKGDDGVTHHLYHMRDMALARSGHVDESTHVGYVGTTGASTGSHLHWETRRNDVDFAPGSWLFAGLPVYIPQSPAPQPTREFVRIFGDFRTFYATPGGMVKTRLLPNQLGGGHLDYEVLAHSGNFVKIQTQQVGQGWLYVGSDVSHLTQFYKA